VVPNLIVTMYVLWRLFRGLTQLTGITLEEIFHSQRKV